jgi:large subunit ribosomal protein L6
MSRVGKKTIPIPGGVQVRVEGKQIYIKGPKGELSRKLEPQITISIEDTQVQVKRDQDDRITRSLHGLVRSDLNNMLNGVTKGFSKTLEINGVGFRAQVQGRALQLNLGYSHPVNFTLPPGIDATVEKQTIITIRGMNKYLVGQVAANLKSCRPPEPYKGKGIKYSGEVIIRKEGKSGK